DRVCCRVCSYWAWLAPYFTRLRREFAAADVQLDVMQAWSDVVRQAEIHLITLRARVSADSLNVLHRATAYPDFDIEGTRNLFQRQRHPAIFHPLRSGHNARDGRYARDDAESCRSGLVAHT